VNPECADQCLVTLLEYIEDCQFAQVHLNILQIVEDYVLKLNINPYKFIRYIFNRINLESSEIRTACISTLGKFALHHSNLKSQIISILKQVLNDPDEETSERAYYYICILENQ
jgi:coatomer subunit gamma